MDLLFCNFGRHLFTASCDFAYESLNVFLFVYLFYQIESFVINKYFHFITEMTEALIDL